MPLGGTASTTFANLIQGTYGSFTTPAGRVSYISTKARLGSQSVDAERRLTRHLLPVREVLQAEDLDFNQLLQRDLDDHRVATTLIPYLLEQKATGPAFFPPVVAALLPFSGRRPSTFPRLGKPVFESADGLEWLEEVSGEAFKVRRLAEDADNLHRINLGELWWNDEHSRLVVLDGQHRAMALLAIERTLQRTWQGSGGERYRYFYEDRIKDLLKQYSDVDLDSVELPVSVIWFPDYVGPDKNPHTVARKLFVDINREARQPSESRLILLSDAEMMNVLTRSLLTALRNDKDGDFLPLYCVEYDNPETNTTRPARWSVSTNIHLLKQAVSRLVFGPDKYLSRMDVRIGRREPLGERDAFMRTQLDVDSFLPAVLEYEGFRYKRSELGNVKFPLDRTGEIAERFDVTWGSAILTLISGVEQYAAHARALSALKDKWLPDEAVSSLAYDALFNGVGMYWTLRESSEFYQRQPDEGKPRSPKPDIVKAWDLIADKQRDFEALRAIELMGSSSPANIASSNALYQVMNTHACQLGMLLAFGTIWTQTVQSASVDHVAEFATTVTGALNSWFAENHGKANDHRLVFSREVTKPVNFITNMDTPRAIQFRYFWLEIIRRQSNADGLPGFDVDWAVYDKLLGESRHDYLSYFTDATAAALKTTRPDLSETMRKKAAKSFASSELRKGLGKWFGLAPEEYNFWEAGGQAENSEGQDSGADDGDEVSVDLGTDGEDSQAELERLMSEKDSAD